MKRSSLLLIVLSVFTFGGAMAQGNSSNTYPVFNKDTKWRGVFTLPSGDEVPFNFLIGKKEGGANKLYFLNGEEKFEGGNLSFKNDSLYVSFDQFENELALKYGENGLKGLLRKQNGSGTPTPVSAEINRTDRFAEAGSAPATNLSGTYDVRFGQGEREEKAVGLFKQDGNKLKATFMRVTGDARYLEGIVEGNQFRLSAFIGSSPTYYRGSFDADKKISGEVVGARSVQKFSAAPDADASLPDAYKLTALKDDAVALDFTFPDVNGKPVSLKDEKYRNKVVIVTIGGTWCPNCMDETAFLAPWYDKNKSRGVEVISLQYERNADPAYAAPAIKKYRDRFKVKYEQLIAGVADKEKVAESLPMLNTFLSFPTTIFVGKDGKVSKIHTGFSGPATGKYYDDFRKEFESEVASLLKK